MLKILCQVLLWLLFGLIATMLMILVLVFILSLPELLFRLSCYIGSICTWIIFIFIITSIILICINYKR